MKCPSPSPGPGAAAAPPPRGPGSGGRQPPGPAYRPLVSLCDRRRGGRAAGGSGAERESGRGGGGGGGLGRGGGAAAPAGVPLFLRGQAQGGASSPPPPRAPAPAPFCGLGGGGGGGCGGVRRRGRERGCPAAVSAAGRRLPSPPAEIAAGRTTSPAPGRPGGCRDPSAAISLPARRARSVCPRAPSSRRRHGGRGGVCVCVVCAWGGFVAAARRRPRAEGAPLSFVFARPAPQPAEPPPLAAGARGRGPAALLAGPHHAHGPSAGREPGSGARAARPPRRRCRRDRNSLEGLAARLLQG
ncbi:translation initiation factor IF-2-like [Aquila chrysaetos chrysaetos]|uniref:translation initiation factor IF-2-like n=1 Tax=Aquila chrysaetos chrysaetos TaxID=223781 RepID=UPI001176C5BA|nr:translation initiation factor IF-2-like [Aquila chrysaetos chrysaetos]